MSTFESDIAITADVEAAVLRGAPMNTVGTMYPRVRFETLGADAQQLYLSAGRQKLDRDVFDPKARTRYVSPSDADNFIATERMLDAIVELERAGYARYEPKWQSLYRTSVHPAYTIAYGRGSQVIEVRMMDAFDDPGGQLIAVLIGADLESSDSRSGSLPEVNARARHATGTDSEHDASSTALFTIANPSPPQFHGYGQMTFAGVLTQARMYPLGTDPAEMSDADTSPGVCESERCDAPHPFVPFLPPLVKELSGRPFVRVSARPFRPYLVRDLTVPAPSYRERNADD